MLWLTSWIAGRWLPLVVAAAIAAGGWFAYLWAYNRGEAASEARWAAQVEAARVDAARIQAAQTAAVVASNGALKDAQEQLAAADVALRAMADGLRQYTTRPRDLPAPADYPRCVAELAAERDWAGALTLALAGSNDLAVSLATERDDAVARLWAASEAWPR